MIMQNYKVDSYVSKKLEEIKACICSLEYRSEELIAIDLVNALQSPRVAGFYLSGDDKTNIVVYNQIKKCLKAYGKAKIDITSKVPIPMYMYSMTTGWTVSTELRSKMEAWLQNVYPCDGDCQAKLSLLAETACRQENYQYAIRVNKILPIRKSAQQRIVDMIGKDKLMGKMAKLLFDRHAPTSAMNSFLIQHKKEMNLWQKALFATHGLETNIKIGMVQEIIQEVSLL